MRYEHTQTGKLMWIVLFGVATLFLAILTQSGFDPVLLILMTVIIVILAMFTSLKVTIDRTQLAITFAAITVKRIQLSNIVLAEPVRNKWYYGWGIRYWPVPSMLIFNVSGFDAVEIITKSGKRYRIGTDEPKKLHAAIMQGIR
jgi:hypothetical protein